VPTDQLISTEIDLVSHPKEQYLRHVYLNIFWSLQHYFIDGYLISMI